MRGSTASLRLTVPQLTTTKERERQRSDARAPRPPRVCPTCGARVGDLHDTEAHYRALMRRAGVAVEGDAHSQ
jgi:hypothetical protein